MDSHWHQNNFITFFFTASPLFPPQSFVMTLFLFLVKMTYRHCRVVLSCIFSPLFAACSQIMHSFSWLSPSTCLEGDKSEAVSASEITTQQFTEHITESWFPELCVEHTLHKKWRKINKQRLDFSHFSGKYAGRSETLTVEREKILAKHIQLELS